jgi:hypothetical protein
MNNLKNAQTGWTLFYSFANKCTTNSSVRSSIIESHILGETVLDSNSTALTTTSNFESTSSSD